MYFSENMRDYFYKYFTREFSDHSQQRLCEEKHYSNFQQYAIGV